MSKATVLWEDKAMNKTLLSLLLLPALGLPAQAQSNLQWRSTTCQVEQDGRVIATGKCQAGFAYDTAVRAIKYWDAPAKRWTYDEVGQAGVSFGNARECLVTRYTDGAVQATCTVPTPEQLGIKGY
jgi:hypothetical protein